MQKPLHIAFYVFADYISSAISWLVFSLFFFNINNIGSTIFASFIIVPFCWLLLFLLIGSYALPIYKKSRLNEFTNTFFAVILGAIIIYLTLLYKGNIVGGISHYSILIILILLHTFFVFILRWLILIKAKNDFLSGKISFNTIIIGNNLAAVTAYNELQKNYVYLGYKIVGFIGNENNKNGLNNICLC